MKYLTPREIGDELAKRVGEGSKLLEVDKGYIIGGEYVPACHVCIRMGGAKELLESMLNHG